MMRIGLEKAQDVTKFQLFSLWGIEGCPGKCLDVTMVSLNELKSV